MGIARTFLVLQKVRLIKRADGFWEMGENVPIGKEYWIFPSSARKETFINSKTGIAFDSFVVDAEEGYLPVDVLEFTNEFKLLGGVG